MVIERYKFTISGKICQVWRVKKAKNRQKFDRQRGKKKISPFSIRSKRDIVVDMQERFTNNRTGGKQ